MALTRETEIQLSRVPWYFAMVAVVTISVAAIWAPLGLRLHIVTIIAAACIAYPMSVVSRLTGALTLLAAPLVLAGGYVGGYLSYELELELVAVVLGVAIFGAVLGALIAMPARNLSLLYTIVVTLSAIYIVYYITLQVGHRIGHATGMPFGDANILGTGWGGPTAVTVAILCLFAINVFWAHFLPRTQVGRLWMADTASREFSATLGVSHSRVLVSSFSMLGSLLAAAGCLIGYRTGVIVLEYYNVAYSISFLAVMIIGGVRHPWGAVVGATAYVLLPLFFSWLSTAVLGDIAAASQLGSYLGTGVFGLALLLILLVEPDGVIVLTKRLLRRAAVEVRGIRVSEIKHNGGIGG